MLAVPVPPAPDPLTPGSATGDERLRSDGGGGSGRRALLADLTGVAALAAAGYVVFGLRLGPVIVVLSERRGHGIHSGDLLAVPLALLSVAAFCYARGRRRRDGARRRD